MVDRMANALKSLANAQRIANVENCFGASGQPLAFQGRKLVGEAVLTKMCGKKAKRRQFFLFNDILVYGNIVRDKKEYNKQRIIPLEEVELGNLQDDGILKNGWLIRTPTESFAVYAATAPEKTEWMAHINNCVDDLLKKTAKKPSLEHSAVRISESLSCYDTLTKARANMGCNIPVDKIINQDSSEEDDSEDEMENRSEAQIKTIVENLSLGEEKPTFYGNTAKDSKVASHLENCSTEVMQRDHFSWCV